MKNCRFCGAKYYGEDVHCSRCIERFKEWERNRGKTTMAALRETRDKFLLAAGGRIWR